MTSTNKKAAPPTVDDATNKTSREETTTPTNGGQADRATNRNEAETENARWRANNFCADCGAWVGEGFASCSSQKASRRGPVRCEACYAKREASR